MLAYTQYFHTWILEYKDTWILEYFCILMSDLVFFGNFFFSFLVFFCLLLYKPFVFTKFSEISSENRVQKVGKRIIWKTKNVTNVIIYYMWWPKKIFKPFFALIWPFLSFFTCDFCSRAKIRNRSFQGPPNSWSAW